MICGTLIDSKAEVEDHKYHLVLDIDPDWSRSGEDIPGLKLNVIVHLKELQELCKELKALQER